MFDHIVLRRTIGGLPITAGYIAEALLYYQRLHIIIDRGTLFHLIKQLGTSRILTLLNRPEVSAVYCEEMLATHTDWVGVSQCHNYVTFRLSGHAETSTLQSSIERLEFELEGHGVPKKEAKRFTHAFLQRVPIRKFSGNYFLPGGIETAAKRDLLDIGYAKQAIRHAVAATYGGYMVGEDLKLEVIESDMGFYVFTDINLEAINKKRAQAIPPIESLTIAHLLSHILDARADLALASFYSGDFVTSSVISSIIQARHAEFLRLSNLNDSSRRQFIEIVLPDSPSLAEIIDAGERSIDEFFVLLDRAGRFKDWLKKVNPDEDLVRSYMRDITSEGWVQRLPAKSLRYILTLAVDTTNPLAGLVSGFVDNFVVEKLLSGWRPNHFISGRLAPFIQKN